VIGRLLLRIILVPLGATIALAAAGAMLVVTQRDAFHAVLAADPQAQEDYVFALIVAGPLLVRLMSTWAHYTFVPALAGAFIAETFAIRSWMFHVDVLAPRITTPASRCCPSAGRTGNGGRRRTNIPAGRDNPVMSVSAHRLGELIEPMRRIPRPELRRLLVPAARLGRIGRDPDRTQALEAPMPTNMQCGSGHRLKNSRPEGTKSEPAQSQ
jgi:hypothetical protein